MEPFEPLIGSSTGQPPAFDASMEGQLTVNGPALKTDQLRAALRIPVFQVNTVSTPEPSTGPSRFVMRVRSLRVWIAESFVSTARTWSVRRLILVLRGRCRCCRHSLWNWISRRTRTSACCKTSAEMFIHPVA